MGPVPRKDSLAKQDDVVRIILALEEAGEIVIPRSADDEVVF
jgi:flagellar motor switch protein FliG